MSVNTKRRSYLKRIESKISEKWRDPSASLTKIIASMNVDEALSGKPADAFNHMVIGILRDVDEKSFLPVICSTTPMGSQPNGKASAGKLSLSPNGNRILLTQFADATQVSTAVGDEVTSGAGTTVKVVFKSDKIILVEMQNATDTLLKGDTIDSQTIVGVTDGTAFAGLIPSGLISTDPEENKTSDKTKFTFVVEDAPVESRDALVGVNVPDETWQDFTGTKETTKKDQLKGMFTQLATVISENDFIETAKKIAIKPSLINVSNEGGCTQSIADMATIFIQRVNKDIASIRSSSGVLSGKYFVIASPLVVATLKTAGEVNDSEFDDIPSVVGALDMGDDVLLIEDRYATEDYLITGSRGDEDLSTVNSGIIYQPIDLDIRWTRDHNTLEPLVGVYSAWSFSRNPADSGVTTDLSGGNDSGYLRYSKVTGLAEFVLCNGTGGDEHSTQLVYLGEY